MHIASCHSCSLVSTSVAIMKHAQIILLQESYMIHWPAHSIVKDYKSSCDVLLYDCHQTLTLLPMRTIARLLEGRGGNIRNEAQEVFEHIFLSQIVRTDDHQSRNCDLFQPISVDRPVLDLKLEPASTLAPVATTANG
jgi:hypothetical protein